MSSNNVAKTLQAVRRTVKIDTEAYNLRLWKAEAERLGGWVVVRQVGALKLETEVPYDAQLEDFVPGAALEGVRKVNEDTYPAMEITIWAGGEMMSLNVGEEAEVELRLVADPDIQFPGYDVCGRCNRHFNPGQTTGSHVGC